MKYEDNDIGPYIVLVESERVTNVGNYHPMALGNESTGIKNHKKAGLQLGIPTGTQVTQDV